MSHVVNTGWAKPLMNAKLGWGMDWNKEQDICMSKCLPHRLGTSYKGGRLEEINSHMANKGR